MSAPLSLQIRAILSAPIIGFAILTAPIIGSAIPYKLSSADQLRYTCTSDHQPAILSAPIIWAILFSYPISYPIR